jgi:hypothetical protein
MIIFWKGKGILIIVYFSVSTIVLGITYRLLIENFEFLKNIELPFLVFAGFVLIVTGLWTKLTAETYYVDKQGRKKTLDIVNDFFFIKMSTWGIILPSIGIGLIIWGLVKGT